MASFETQLLLNLNEFEFDTSTELTVEMIKSVTESFLCTFTPILTVMKYFAKSRKR
jgi:hypothetical protein